MPDNKTKLIPGQHVAVTQQIAQPNNPISNRTVGQILSYNQQKTGSWFAHSRHTRLWLDRLTLKKDDGEIVVINLDPYTHIEFLPAESPAS